MYTFIVIALLAAVVVYAIAKKTAKPEPVTPEITEQEIHADLHSHVEPTPPIVVIEPPIASVAPIVEVPAVADEKPAVIAAAKKKPAKKAKKKVDA